MASARTRLPQAAATRAMAATPHPLASVAALRALARGGSAADAAIVANAVLAVVYPHMAGLGGDAVLLTWTPADARVRAILGLGPAAALATRELYAARGHPEEIPTRGPLAALTVPGAVDAWRLAHEAHGRLPWADLFEDARRLARDGAPVAGSTAAWLAQKAVLLRRHEPAARLLLPGGEPPREGALLRMPGLARTFERLAREGPREGFYEGETALALCDAVAPRGSPLRPDDFARYQARWAEPVATTYRGVRVLEAPPPTQGVSALMLLDLLEGYDVEAWGDGSADYYHHCAEAAKVAFADRDEWITDPDAVAPPLERLLSKEYARERRALIAAERALDLDRVAPGVRFDAGARLPSPPVGGDTIALCVVDEEGGAVSLIQSIYHDFGTAEVGGDTGVLLGNRGASFSLDPRRANRLEPRKRPFHTLTPGLALGDDGAPSLLFGTMGGDGQPQTHLALLTRLVDFGMGVQEAIEAPRWLAGRTWGARTRDVSLEGRIAPEVVAELRRRGQPVRVLGDWDDNLGHLQAIRIQRDEGLLEGGADPRGDGLALGW